MSFAQKFRRFVGADPAQAALLRPLIEEGKWPRGGSNRYVAHGMPKDVLETLRLEIKSLADWERAFGHAARRYRAMAEKQVGTGDAALASRYFLVSASCAFHAQLLPMADGRRAAELRYECRSAFRHAAEHLQPPLEPVLFNFKGGQTTGYFRPVPAEACGTVVLLNSQQTCKEDLYYFTQPMLDVGLNALVLDTPGTGEALPQLPYGGAEEILAALEEQWPALRGAGGVPALLFGLGVGAAVALQMCAKAPKRFKAAALLSPPYDLQLEHEKLKPWVREELAAFLGCKTNELPDALGRVRCAGLPARVHTRVLIIGAAKDRDFPGKQAKQLAREFGKGRTAYWGFGHSGHCAYEKQPQLRTRIAQWLGKHVGGTLARDEYMDEFEDDFDDANGD